MAPAIDRISSLPESLATAILTLLPIRDAVRTGALSRHWRHAWRLIPNIDVNIAEFPSLPACIDFILDRLLTYPTDAAVDSFSLTLPEPGPRLTLLASILHFAISRGTKTLTLDFAGPARDFAAEPFEIPAFVSRHHALHSLTLFACSFTLPNSTNLISLKTASFGCMEFPNAALTTLLNGCPLLESLSLFRCIEASEYVYSFASASLTTLSIEGCIGLMNLTVDAPNLRRFKYAGNMIGFGVENLGALEEAHVNLGSTPEFSTEIADAVQKLLSDFHNATSITVCGYITQALEEATKPLKLPRVLRAKLLIIESDLESSEYNGIACLLNSCPNLEKLQFNVTPQIIVEPENDEYLRAELAGNEGVLPAAYPNPLWGEEFRVPRCVARTLREVEMDGAWDSEMLLLKYFFEHGSVLRKLRVRLQAADEGPTRAQLHQDMTRIFSSWRSKYSRPLLDIDVSI